jgi:hypothetical protein
VYCGLRGRPKRILAVQFEVARPHKNTAIDLKSIETLLRKTHWVESK